jgi:predicted permease
MPKSPHPRFRELWRYISTGGTMHLRWLEELGTDLRFAQRTLRRSPGFLLTAVISLALGIGANVSIFTTLDAILWRPLPVAHPDELVRFAISRIHRTDRGSLPSEFARDLRAAQVFSDIVAFSSDGFSFSYDGRAERVQGEVVSANFFPFLGMEPFLGQGFTPDVRAGRWAAETVLSHRFWMRRFGGDPHVVGKIIHINTYPFTIVGVSPPAFRDVVQGYEPDLRLPVMPDGQRLKQSQMLDSSLSVGMARLAPHTSLAQAEAETNALFQNFLRATASPQVRSAGYQRIRVMRAPQGLPGDVVQFRAPLLVLFALVGVVLLIACANLAGLLLARATARRRELVTRASIGASRLRLVRQMLGESLLIASLGGALSVPIANWSGAMLLGFVPQGHTPLTVDLRPDARALVFTLCLSLLTTAVFGVAPALQATRGDLAGMLKSDSFAVSQDRRSCLRSWLVVAQVAFSVVLLAAAGVFIGTLAKLRVSDYQTPADRVLLFTLKPQPEIYTPDHVRAVTTEVVRRVSELPGVLSAGLAENGPLGSRTDRESVESPGHDVVQAVSDYVTPGFFDSIGMRRIDGRDFTNADHQGTSPVAVINQALSRILFPNQNPVGRTLMLSQQRNRVYEIVGVVADAHYYDVHGDAAPGVWFAIEQFTPYMPTLHVRTNSRDPAAMIAAVRREFDAIDKGFPVFNVKTLQLRIEDSLARERMLAALSAASGILALLLSAIGLYGILAYSVSHRTREIGIRMALGSSPFAVVWLMARQALVLVAAGSVAGIAIASVASRLLTRYLVGAFSLEASTLLTSVASLLIIAAIAASIPSMRASQIDPMTALRQE